MISEILQRLKKVKKNGKHYIACCPSHNDKNPSLSLTELPDGRILMKCFAGCDIYSILSAINLTVSDLFPKGCLGHYRSFVALERKYENQDMSHDEIILAIAKADRTRGIRLSEKDMEIERQAYLRIRNAKSNR